MLIALIYFKNKLFLVFCQLQKQKKKNVKKKQAKKNVFFLHLQLQPRQLVAMV